MCVREQGKKKAYELNFSNMKSSCVSYKAWAQLASSRAECITY